MEYYIQTLIKRQLDGMKTNKRSFFVCDEYLSGISADEFLAAYGELHGIIFNFYSDMFSNPESFGAPLHEIDKFDPFSREARKDSPVSAMSEFIQCAGFGAVLNDGYIAVDLAAFNEIKNKIRAKKLSVAVDYMSKNGFVFHNMKGDKFDRNAKEFIIEYPDNNNVLNVLYAAADRAAKIIKRNGNYIVYEPLRYLYYGLFANNSDEEVVFCIDDFSRVVPPADYEFILNMTEGMKELGFGYSAGFLRIDFTDKKGRPTNDFFEYTPYRYEKGAGGKLRLKLKLNNLKVYSAEVDRMSGPIKNSISNAFTCSHLYNNHGCRINCNNRVCFTLNGEYTEKCICCNFNFYDIHINRLNEYLDLVRLEYEAKYILKTNKNQQVPF